MRTLLLLLALTLSTPALAAAQDVAVGDASEAQTFYERGREHFAAGRVAAAASHFVAALELDPGHRQARAYLVECLVIEDRVDEARAVAQGGPPGEGSAPRPDSQQPPISSGPPPDLPVLTDDDTVEPVPPPAEIERPVAAPPAETTPPAPPPPIVEVPAPSEAPARRSAATERQARRDRTARRNPRALSKLSAGVAVGGAAVTVGGFVELRPTWVGGFGLGLGGFLFPADDRVVGAVAFSMEGQFTPVPFRLTPILGGGLMVLGGSGVYVTEPVLGSLPSVGNSRVVPYGVFGARYDLRKALWFSVTVRVAPSPRTGAIPLPGARLGLRF